MGGEWRRAAGGWMALGWSVLVLWLGLVLLVTFPWFVRSTEDGYCENIDHPGPCANVLELLVPGAVVSAVGAGHVVASVGFRRRRPWARWAVVTTFSLWALAAFAGLVAAADDAFDSAGPGSSIVALIGLSFFVTTAVLVADQGTGR